MFRLLLLGSSAALNIFLAGWWWHLTRTANDEPARDAAAVPTAPVQAPVPVEKRWAALNEAVTDRDFAQGLKAHGFPDRVIRVLVSMRIKARHAEQLKALAQKNDDAYWKRRMWDDRWPRQRAALREVHQQIYRETEATLAGLIDEDPIERSERLERYGDLPLEKARAAGAILSDYADLGMQVRESAGNYMLPEDREKMALLEREKYADLAALLTPQELDNFELRSSRSALSLQYGIRHFDATEEEYVKLFRLRKAFDDRYGIGQLAPDKEEQRRQAQSALTQQIAAALGSERFAEYEVALDGNFDSTLVAVRAANQSRELASELVRYQRQALRAAETIRADSSLSPEQRRERLKALAEQSKVAVGEKLGVEHLPKYLRMAGSWVEKIAPSANRKNP